MGYSKEHVESTRRRILEAAERLFRQHGYDGVGIDKIMEAAGLTRGGFYAHFRSKADLFAAMLAQEFDFEHQVKKLAELPRGKIENRTQFALEHYLAFSQRDKIGNACTMASSATDVARAGDDAKAAFGASMMGVVEAIEILLRADGQDPDREQVLADLCLSVGALVLARANNDEIAKPLLDAALKRLGESAS